MNEVLDKSIECFVGLTFVRGKFRNYFKGILNVCCQRRLFRIEQVNVLVDALIVFKKETLN